MLIAQVCINKMCKFKCMCCSVFDKWKKKTERIELSGKVCDDM